MNLGGELKEERKIIDKYLSDSSDKENVEEYETGMYLKSSNNHHNPFYLIIYLIYYLFVQLNKFVLYLIQYSWLNLRQHKYCII